jgi:hypothetical protein
VPPVLPWLLCCRVRPHLPSPVACTVGCTAQVRAELQAALAGAEAQAASLQQEAEARSSALLERRVCLDPAVITALLVSLQSSPPPFGFKFCMGT